MSSRLRTSLLAAVALLVALALGACGDSHTKVSTGTYAGESGAAAPYLDVGPLVYQVQLSRQLNPYDTEDAAYLAGLSSADRELAHGQEWFAVFMQVYNNGSGPAPASSNISLSDTQGNTYFPTTPNQSNSFAYRAGIVTSKGRLPELSSVAIQGPTQGELLLYKIEIVSLDNRPLKIKIVDPGNASLTASAELDV